MPTGPRLPLEVAEGAIRLGHLVRILAALDRGAQTVHRIDELGRELLAHRLAVPLAGGLDEPAHAEREAAVAADLDRHLVRRAADSPRLDLDDRSRVAQSGLEDLEARSARLRLG